MIELSWLLMNMLSAEAISNLLGNLFGFPAPNFPLSNAHCDQARLSALPLEGDTRLPYTSINRLEWPSSKGS